GWESRSPFRRRSVRGLLDRASLLLAGVAAQEKSDQESDADRDQQRLAGIGADVAADLIGDGAEVDVVELLAGAVVLVLDGVGRRRIFVVDVVLGAVEAGGVAFGSGSVGHRYLLDGAQPIITPCASASHT